MHLTYKYITRHIVRCFLDAKATVIVGPNQRVTTTYYDCSEFNMSAVIASRATICTKSIHTDEGSAVIEWRESGLVKTSGDLEVEISKEK